MRNLKTLVMSLVLLAGVALLASCYPTGTTPEPGQGEGGASSIIPLIVFLVLIFGMFYLLIIRPQRKRQRDQQNLLGQLKRGDKVITAGGIYGVIESTGDDSVTIRVESGATMRVAKSSIAVRREQ